jgi:arsenate reductase
MNPDTVTIYHNPACGTSRNTLALIRNSGTEPTVIEYLKTPPSPEVLRGLIEASGLSVRGALRQKEPLCHELGLDDPRRSDEDLLDAMLRQPILINRPFVVTARGTRLCRPAEVVLDLLPQAQQGAFTKQDGERVVHAEGRRVGKPA